MKRYMVAKGSLFHGIEASNGGEWASPAAEPDPRKTEERYLRNPAREENAAEEGNSDKDDGRELARRRGA